jgi:3-oxoadipate enol-lactonase
MPDVNAAGCRLSYVVDGSDGPVLLLSNPLGTTRDLWAPQAAPLAARFRVVRYDTRGHGASQAPEDGYTLERLGADVVAILDDLGVARAHVAGMSLGGLTAMQLGLAAPDRVDRLVLANTAARIGSREIWESRIVQVRTEGLASVAAAALDRWFTPAFRAREPELAAASQAMLLGISPIGYAGCAGVLRDADLRDEVSRIDRPVLVITGAHDPVTTPADAAFLCERIAGARACTLDAAHFSNVEAADAFTAALLDFLAA